MLAKEQKLTYMLAKKLAHPTVGHKLESQIIEARRTNQEGTGGEGGGRMQFRNFVQDKRNFSLPQEQ
jgi:hypothetical protein